MIGPDLNPPDSIFIEKLVYRPTSVTIDRRIARSALTLRAKGLFVTLLDLFIDYNQKIEDGEQVPSLTINALAKYLRQGEESFLSAVRELEQVGLLSRTRIRKSGGQLGGTQWLLRDTSATVSIRSLEALKSACAGISPKQGIRLCRENTCAGKTPVQGKPGIGEPPKNAETKTETPCCDRVKVSQRNESLPKLAVQSLDLYPSTSTLQITSTSDLLSNPITVEVEGDARGRRRSEDVPDKLKPIATEILDWWHNTKAGVKTPLAWKRQMTEFMKILNDPRGSLAEIKVQINRAERKKVMSGKSWDGLYHDRWAEFGLSKASNKQEGGQRPGGQLPRL